MKSRLELENALFLVPVPIGNREDISLRALKVLASVDVIACEDTRNTGRLLRMYSIQPPKLLSVHEHNEERRADDVAALLREGKSVALVSDAGTPAVSDPGFRIVRAVSEAGLKVVPLPGPNAALTALIASGLPTDRFSFLGFPPHKKGRTAFVNNLLSHEDTCVVYEAPHRIKQLLQELQAAGAGQRRVCLSRELTKKFEEHLRASVDDLLAMVEERGEIKGEVVLVVGGAERNAIED